MVKRLLVSLLAVLGLSAGLAPSAAADGPPITGSRIDLSVTATTNGVQTNRSTIISFNRDNVVANDWFNVDATPWHQWFYVHRSPYGFLYLSAQPTNPNPVYGVVTYTCKISVNGVVVSSHTGVSSVTCSI